METEDLSKHHHVLRHPKRKVFWGIIIASIPVSMLVAFIGRGSFGHFVGVVSLSIWVGGFLAVIALISLMIHRAWRLNIWRWMTVLSLASLVSLVVLMGSIPLGAFLNRKDMKEARLFCDALIPSIDAERARIGTYPERIDNMISGHEIPRLVHPDTLYTSTGNAFTLFISDPSGIFSGLRYDSETRKWSDSAGD